MTTVTATCSDAAEEVVRRMRKANVAQVLSLLAFGLTFAGWLWFLDRAPGVPGDEALAVLVGTILAITLANNGILGWVAAAVPSDVRRDFPALASNMWLAVGAPIAAGAAMIAREAPDPVMVKAVVFIVAAAVGASVVALVFKFLQFQAALRWAARQRATMNGSS